MINVLGIFVSLVFFVVNASAQSGMRPTPGPSASESPAQLREVGFDQQLDQPLPLDTAFRDESGRTVMLREYFGARPVVLVFAYYNCPMLCTQVLNGLASALKTLTLAPGRDFEVVTISFDPHDTPKAAADKKADYLERYGRSGAAAATHFLTGDQPAIDRLTKAAGFRYVWDQPTQQFAHPTGIIVVTPEGRLSRYLFGIEYGARDLRLGLVDASAGRIGSPVDTLLLYCFHYDPTRGRYSLAIIRALQIGAVLTVVSLGLLIGLMLRKERHAAPLP